MNVAEFVPEAAAAAGLVAAMANAKRLLILCNLFETERSVSELAGRVHLAPSALSQHLAKLRALQLVTARREGQMVFYRLASDDVARLLATLHGLYCSPSRGDT